MWQSTTKHYPILKNNNINSKGLPAATSTVFSHRLARPFQQSQPITMRHGTVSLKIIVAAEGKALPTTKYPKEHDFW